MEDKILKYIAAFALIGFCAFAVIMIAAVIGTHQPGLNSFLNWPAFGPIISAIATIIALFIAVTGWKKSAKDREDDREHEKTRKDVEIKRMAMAHAKTLFREFEAPTNAAQTSLHNYHSITETQYKYVLERPQGITIPTGFIRIEFFKEVVNEAQTIAKGLPHDQKKFCDVDRLYQFSDELGDAAVEVNVSLTELGSIAARIEKKGTNGLNNSYEPAPSDTCPIIYFFIFNLTSLLLSLEKFRKMLNNTSYRQSASEATLKELMKFTENLTHVQLNTSPPIIHGIEYIKMLSALEEYYGNKIQEYS